MASRVMPGMGLRAEYALGEDGWKPGMDQNLIDLSVLTNLNAQAFVGSLPGSPAEGDIYILNAGVNINRIAVRDQGQWKFWNPKQGFRAWIANTQQMFAYNGFDWVAVIGDFGDYIADALAAAEQAEAAADEALAATANAGKSIQGFGGADNGNGADGTGATNNDAAFAAAAAALQPGQRLILPKTNTGRYYCATRSDFSMFDLDPNGEEIMIYGPSVYNAGGTHATGKLILRNTSGVRFDFEIYADPTREPKYTFFNEADRDTSMGFPLVCNDGSGPVQRVSWPSGDTFSDYATGSTLAADNINMNLGAMSANYWQGPFWDAEWGASYTAAFEGAGAKGVMIRTTQEWILLYGSPGGGGKNLVIKVPSTAKTEVTLPQMVDADLQQDFWPVNAVLGVDILAHNAVQFTVNGVNVADTYYTVGDIEYVGFVVFTTGDAGTGIIHSPTKTRRPLPAAARPKRVLVMGDSLTDDINPGWPQDFREMLQSSFGTQVEYINNIAVAGDSLQDQLDDLAALSLSGYTDLVMMIGANNIQGQIANFKSQLDAFFTQVQGAYLNVTLVVAPNYYSQALAQAYGGQGQNTGNYEKGSRYRAQMIRKAADKYSTGANIGIVDSMRVLGPTFARYLNWNALLQFVDPNVFDNIHITRRARRILAQAITRKVLGLERPYIRRGRSEAVIPASWYSAGWGPLGGDYNNARYSVGEDGRRYLHGVVSLSSSHVDGGSIMTLPRFMRPNTGLYLTGAKGWNAVAQLIVGANGTLLTGGVVSGNYISLDGCSWPARFPYNQ